MASVLLRGGVGGTNLDARGGVAGGSIEAGASDATVFGDLVLVVAKVLVRRAGRAARTEVGGGVVDRSTEFEAIEGTGLNGGDAEAVMVFVQDGIGATEGAAGEAIGCGTTEATAGERTDCGGPESAFVSARGGGDETSATTGTGFDTVEEATGEALVRGGVGAAIIEMGSGCGGVGIEAELRETAGSGERDSATVRVLLWTGAGVAKTGVGEEVGSGSMIDFGVAPKATRVLPQTRAGAGETAAAIRVSNESTAV